jgi:hypothetical protein
MQTNTLLTQLRKHYPSINKVVDARKPLTVEVTKNDVKRGKKKDHDQCAIAKACMRSNHPDYVIAARSRIYIIKKGIATRYFTSPRIMREITSFDRGAQFTPGVYTLLAVPNSHKLSNKTKGSWRRTKSNGSLGSIHRPVIDNIRTAIGDF